MAETAEIFPELERAQDPSTPAGFRYRANVINAAEETTLVAALQKLDLKPFEFQGRLANRRVLSFGLRYDYSRRKVETASEFPSFMNEVRAMAAEFAGRVAGEFQQAGVSEYGPGAGIGWHKDKAHFGVVVGVSLLAPATMRFRRARGRGWDRVSHTIARRSIYLLAGEARTKWEHSIPPLDELRYSLTFRTLSDRILDQEAPRPQNRDLNISG
jgi:alkylated DNA repair dioxygenase AlkB